VRGSALCSRVWNPWRVATYREPFFLGYRRSHTGKGGKPERRKIFFTQTPFGRGHDSQDFLDQPPLTDTGRRTEPALAMATTRQSSIKQPTMAQARSLLAFQNQIARGAFADRHLQALAMDKDTVSQFASIIDCTTQAQEFMAANPNKQRQLQTRQAPPPPCSNTPRSLAPAWARILMLTSCALPLAVFPQEPRVRMPRRLSRGDAGVGSLFQGRHAP
jgi:hypothetical protein